jgi:tetratricopeptide (TPR) repeat protein
MKKLLLSASLAMAGLAFGQEKEVKKAFKAYEDNDLATATAQMTAAEALLSNNKIYSLEAEYQEQYYYTKGMLLLKEGKNLEAAGFLAKAGEYSSEKLYRAKHKISKEKVYVLGKAQADKLNADGNYEFKQEDYEAFSKPKISIAVNNLLQTTNNEAMAAYKAKNYGVASTKFEEVYLLQKAQGNAEAAFLYYAAVTSYSNKNYKEAIRLYKDLVAMNYTGVSTNYTAKNKLTGEVEDFTQKKAMWEVQKKTGLEYSDFQEKQTPSQEIELYENLGLSLSEEKKYDECIATMDQALAKFPEHNKFTDIKSNAYFQSGNMDKFTQSLKDGLAKNPSDKTAWFNLAVLTSKDPNKAAEAEGYFKKALEQDPNYIPALQGIFYNVYLGDDAKAIADANTAKKAGKTEVFNKILADRKARFAKGIVHLEKWHSLEPNNKDLIGAMKGIYQSLGKTEKVAEMKALEAK